MEDCQADRDTRPLTRTCVRQEEPFVHPKCKTVNNTHTHKMKESTFPLTQEVTRTCECSVEKRDEASRQDNNPTRPLRCPRAKNMSVKRR